MELKEINFYPDEVRINKEILDYVKKNYTTKIDKIPNFSILKKIPEFESIENIFVVYLINFPKLKEFIKELMKTNKENQKVYSELSKIYGTEAGISFRYNKCILIDDSLKIIEPTIIHEIIELITRSHDSATLCEIIFVRDNLKIGIDEYYNQTFKRDILSTKYSQLKKAENSLR